MPFAGTFGAESRAGSLTATQVVLEGATDQKTGTVLVSRKTGALNFALKFTGNLDQSTGEAVPLTSDGLSSAARVAFSFSRWNWSGPSEGEQKDYRKLCRDQATKCTGGCLLQDFREADRSEAEQILTPKPPTREQLEEFRDICKKWTGDSSCSLADLLDPAISKRAKELLGGPGRDDAQARYLALCRQKATACDCDTGDFADPATRGKALHMLHADRRPWFFGGTVEVGRTPFKYLDPVSLGSQSANHDDWLLGARVGIFLAPVGFLLGSYSYSKTYSAAGAATTFCTPLDSSSVEDATLCRSAVLGAPTSNEGSIVGIELRRISADGVGMAPAVRRLIDRKVTTVELPIYFIPAKDKSLVGGVRVGWRSDENSVTVSVFVGGAFSLTR